MNRLLVCPVLVCLLLAYAQAQSDGDAAPAVVAEGTPQTDGEERLRLTPIPAPMDAEALHTLADEPHDAAGMMPELEIFPEPGRYRLDWRTGSSANDLKEQKGFDVTLKVVRGRFIVEASHDQNRSDRFISVWTCDGEPKIWRHWLLSPESLVESRGAYDQAEQTLHFESVQANEDGGSTTRTYSFVSNDRFTWTGQYSIDGKVQKVWQGESKRIGELGEKQTEEMADKPDDGDWRWIPVVILVIVAIAAAITLIIELVIRGIEKDRTRALEEPVQELGLTIQPEGDSALQEELGDFPLFNLGRKPALTNLIVADTPEVSISIFDYKYVTGYGKDKRNHRQTVIAVRSPELETPVFHLRPERMLDAIGGMLGGQDIDFENHPEFSRAFVLKSETEEETRTFFDESLLDFFASNREITFEAKPGTFLYYRRRKRVEPSAEDLRKFLGEGLQAFDAMRNRLSSE